MAELELKYNDPSFPGAFSGITKFRRGLDARGVEPLPKKREVKEFLKGQNSYTLHYPARRRIKRNRVVVGGVGHLAESDLLSFESLSSDNDGYKFLITFVDVMSKFAYVEKLRSKKADEVVSPFRKILNRAAKDGRLPYRLRTDMGGEYISAKFNKLMREYGIEHYQTKNTEIKSNFAERLNKTIKTMIYKVLTAKKTARYIEFLPLILENYNNSFHSSINTTPASVKKGGLLEQSVWRHQYERHKPHKADGAFKYNVNDYVRISFVAKPFDRAYNQKYTSEVFQVSSREKRGLLNIYFLVDLKKRKIEGSFYEPEILSISFDETGTFEVEKILRTKKVKGKTFYLVRWLNYSSAFDSWVSAKDMV